MDHGSRGARLPAGRDADAADAKSRRDSGAGRHADAADAKSRRDSGDGRHGRAGRREDLWAYRELFAILAWRDLAVRYKQTVIGVAWAVIRPVLTMLIFTVVFGRLAHLQSDGVAPYPVMVFAGMLPWFLFSTILNEASESLVANANLIGKVYFPRLILPCATVFVALTDFSITSALLLAMMGWFHFLPDWHAVALPCFVALAVLGSIGPALLLTAMNIAVPDRAHRAHAAAARFCQGLPHGHSLLARGDHQGHARDRGA